MADFDFLETEFGISEKDLAKPESVYDRLIIDIANQVTSDLREATSKKDQ